MEQLSTRPRRSSPVQRILSKVGLALTTSVRDPMPKVPPPAAQPAESEDVVAAELPAPRPEPIPPAELHIERRLPHNLAVLYVYQHGADAFGLWGGNARQTLPMTGPRDRPNMSVADTQVLENDPRFKRPSQVLTLVREFSATSQELIRWLKSLHVDHGEELRLIIADFTGFEVPWELLDLTAPRPGPHREPLGAVIPTVRWQHFISEDPLQADVVLTVEREECWGEVLAHINSGELVGGGRESEVLRTLNPVTGSLPELEVHLQRDDLRCGLVYVACHGFYDTSISKFAIGSKRDHQQRWVLDRLYGKELKLLRSSRSVVFINACHSGRLIKDRDLRGRYLRGFVELFMRKGARAVIGTMGRVGDEFAAAVGHDLLLASRRAPGVPVASLLRDLRARVLRELPDNPSDEDLRPLIFAFTYVLYGNPMLSLRLVPRPEHADA